jgi:hypothetical protein
MAYEFDLEAVAAAAAVKDLFEFEEHKHEVDVPADEFHTFLTPAQTCGLMK